MIDELSELLVIVLLLPPKIEDLSERLILLLNPPIIEELLPFFI